MIFLLVYLVTASGEYDEKAFMFKSMPACEAAMPIAIQALKKTAADKPEVTGYIAVCQKPASLAEAL